MKRIFSFAFLLLFLSLFSTTLQRMRGGDAAVLLAGQRDNKTELLKLRNEIDAKRNFIGEVFFRMKNTITFNLGKTVKGKMVIDEIRDAATRTIKLALVASLFALFYGVAMGVSSRAFTKINKPLEYLNYFILANPIFIIALVFIWVFSLLLNLLPPGGSSSSTWLVLPSTALGLKAGARLAIFVSEFILREEKKAYVTTLRAYGFSNNIIYLQAILKNIALPSLSFWLIDFASYLAGAAIIETIFSIPGLGTLTLKALYSYDMNLLAGLLSVIAIFIFFTGILQESLDKYYAKFS